jgi:hypothetical protein
MKLFFLFFFLISALSAATRQELVDIVDKINKVKSSVSLESAQWLAEKKSLTLELQLLKDALKSGKQSKVAVVQKIAELRKKKNDLKVNSAAVKQDLSALNKSLDEHLTLLIDFAESVPSSLKSHIMKETSSGKESLESGDGLNKLSSINNLLRGILSLQKGTHRVKEIVKIADLETEVEVLYIGTASGYFLSPSQKSAGRMVYQNGKWTPLIDNSLISKLKMAFAQLDREGIPELVELPLGGDK